VSWISTPHARILTLALVAQAALFWTAARRERIPQAAPLELLPASLGHWQEVQDYPIEQEIRDQLKADDLLNRLYENPATNASVGLFVAYFKSQRTGQSPHSPKNCLPGSGWEPESTGYLDVAVAGEPRPIHINRYVVSHGDERSVVLYWYQSPRRVIASEFAAKFWLVMDSIRYHRSDTALVRVTVPVTNHDDARATRQGASFVQTLFPVLRSYLPA